MKKYYYLVMLLLIQSYVLSGQSDTIPFILTASNNISIKTILNDVDTVNMMFHTGSSAVFVTKAASSRTPSVQLDQNAKVNSWGGSGDVRFSDNNTLQIGPLRWDSIQITEDTHTGPGLDGKFGYNLFQDKVIEMDFDHSYLIVHDQLPDTRLTFEKMKYIYKLGSMFIQGQALLGDKEYTNEVMIHSGYAGALLFDDYFVADNKLADQLETISEQDLKDSMGNVIKTKKSKLPLFRIGEVKFENITVGMFAGSLGRQKFSVMGGDLLKRFNWIFDFKNQEVYLRSNNLRDQPWLD